MFLIFIAIVGVLAACGAAATPETITVVETVIVTEIDPIKAIEARLDGFQVARMEDAIVDADLVITATGMKDVVRKSYGTAHMLSDLPISVAAKTGTAQWKEGRENHY